MESSAIKQEPIPATMPESVDPDTCRICRGEATIDEPLFYPCKCSGSIRFVHQDCLMEWLSHSQKKHCELCKTPYRFTKLYHPQMPARLPTAVFLRRAVMHCLKQIFFWCRGLLVFSVWLVFLPWAMRSVWRFLFWFADSGWARTVQIEMNWPSYLAGSYPTNRSVSNPTTKFMDEEQWRSANSSQPLLYRLVRTFVVGATHSSHRELHFSMTANSTFNSSTHELIRKKYSSILSDVTFLRDLSPSVSFNRTIMDILEGIIITLSVVVAFILIFLIREWVIQQQPIANLGQAAADQVDQDRVIVGAEQANTEADRLEIAVRVRELGGDVNNLVQGPLAMGPERITQYMDPEGPSRLTTWEMAEVIGLELTNSLLVVEGPARETFINRTEEQLQSTTIDQFISSLPRSSSDGVHEHSNESRPNMPERAQSSLATEIQRELQDLAYGPSDERLVDSGATMTETSPVSDKLEHDDTNGPSHTSIPGSSSFSTMSASTEPFIAVQDVPTEAANSTKGKASVIEHQDPASANATMDGHSVASLPSRNSGEGNVDFPPPALFTPASSNGTVNVEVEEHGQEAGPASIPSHEPEVLEAPRTWIESVKNWFWGDIIIDNESDDEELRQNDEHVVGDLAAEEPFVPFEDAQPVIPQRDDIAADPLHLAEPVGELGGDGNDINDVEAADDAEDLEGILELIGMQGPIIGLFQNAVFSTLLISCTIVAAVQLPYVLGKLQLVFLGNPDLMWQIPLHAASVTADFVADLLLMIGGYLWYFIIKAVSPLAFVARLTAANSPQVAERAASRLAGSLHTFSSVYEPSASLAFSMLSHASLQRLKQNVGLVTCFFINCVSRLSHGSVDLVKGFASYDLVSNVPPKWLFNHLKNDFESIYSALRSLIKTGTISITMQHDLLDHKDLVLAYWGAKDRLIAVLVGYGCMAFSAAVYVAYFAPISTSTQSRRLELTLVEIIKQAGGVFKVIFIISIEMITFPLFCGFLLDLALLPLFENSTVNSRLLFTYTSPWTSGFVHWFVGTCYMFHFALFVSMCRKIMRAGVLYFIRDPDDPTFHPVRDVLERSVTVQLRKIAFSAIVYGTLITVCLGGVVWSLAISSKSILPIHWSSSESEREFPLDILFFNFLTPLIVKFTKPTDGLHAMYKWWFRRCARTLRLSSFLFNEEHADEEGPYHPRGLTSWLRWVAPKEKVAFKEQTDLSDQRQTSIQTQSDGQANSTEMIDTAAIAARDTVKDSEIVGRYARVPASDQIRIPKGAPIFVEVSKDNKRTDGKPDVGIHSSHLVTKVYIPPWFKVRIGLFVLAVWAFAAATGLSVTIVPLSFGRLLLSVWVPTRAQINDIYAFSLGVYILGGTIYFGLHSRDIMSTIRSRVLSRSPIRSDALRSITNLLGRAASCVYVYTAFAIGLPILLAVILELYILLPLHTYLGRSDTHIVHLVQDWTLGILYVRIFSHFAMAAPTSAPARIAATVLSDGYLRPNARIATRAFILPALIIFVALATIPLLAVNALNATVLRNASSAERVMALRMAYPAALGAVLLLWFVSALIRATRRWRQRIRDEVYLIGERLHNFNEKRQRKTLTVIESLHREHQGVREELAQLREDIDAAHVE